MATGKKAKVRGGKKVKTSDNPVPLNLEEKRGNAPGTKVPGIHDPHSMDGIRRSHKKIVSLKESPGAEEGAYGPHIAPQTFDVHQPSKVKSPNIKSVRKK